jgi:MerR family mercuric resistance operon transcriptional regulator
MKHDTSGKGLHRAALARRTGCNLETIRYYEKIGMMPEPPRTEAGYRVYDDRHVEGLRFILRARELGFSLDDIRGLLALVDRGTQTCAEVKDRTERHLADVLRRGGARLSRAGGADGLMPWSGSFPGVCSGVWSITANTRVHSTWQAIDWPSKFRPLWQDSVLSFCKNKE